MRVFNAHDLLQFAIRVEENGELFYREAVRIADDQGTRDIFTRLASEEVGHKKTFEGMLANLGDYQPAETYEGEYLAYLQNYIDGRVIFKGRPGKPAAPGSAGPGEDAKGSGISEIRDTLSALDFAIQREIDSIVYYQEVKAFVPERHHKVVDGIVGEERKHFSLLSEMRKKYL